MNLTPHSFYEYTPNEYTNMLEGYQMKRDLELKDKEYQAWYNAYYLKLSSNNALPSLYDIMIDKKETSTSYSDKEFIELATKRGLKLPLNFTNGGL